MCPKHPKMSFSSKSQFHGPCMWNRNVKRPKLKPVVASGKWSKWPFFPQKSTFLDILTPKCAQDLPKCLFLQNTHSMACVHKIGLSKGPIEAGGGFWKIEDIVIFSIFFASLLCKLSEIVFTSPQNVIFTYTSLFEPLDCPEVLIKCVKTIKFGLYVVVFKV